MKKTTLNFLPHRISAGDDVTPTLPIGWEGGENNGVKTAVAKDHIFRESNNGLNGHYWQGGILVINVVIMTRKLYQKNKANTYKSRAGHKSLKTT